MGERPGPDIRETLRKADALFREDKANEMRSGRVAEIRKELEGLEEAMEAGDFAAFDRYDELYAQIADMDRMHMGLGEDEVSEEWTRLLQLFGEKPAPPKDPNQERPAPNLKLIIDAMKRVEDAESGEDKLAAK